VSPLIAAAAIPAAAFAQVDRSLLGTLADHLSAEPFDGVATGIFVLAIIHTFATSYFTRRAHRMQHAADARASRDGRPAIPHLGAELLHFLGEVEVVFGLWAVVLLGAMVVDRSWTDATHYFNDTVNYTEPLFVVVIMAMAATRPIVLLAETTLRHLAALGRTTPAAWWCTILIVGPLLGSFITEPAAMTICALLLSRQFFDLNPPARLKYATIGLLFVNVSIGGTLTHFAAPPVLMVARPWEWDTLYMLSHFGWKAIIAVIATTAVYFLYFRKDLLTLPSEGLADSFDAEVASAADTINAPPPAWLTIAHVAFLGWTVATAHYPALFIGGFLIFLGFAKATAAYQSRIDLRSPLLVGFFLAGLVIHGGLQAWWISPVLSRLAETPLFLGAAVLTAFNDNALITYLSTLVPSLTEPLKIAVVQGAVTGGGLTVIANAPNPAGQAILNRFFDGAVAPLGLLLGALLPTLIAGLVFRLL
jgi:hypothetical protein